MDMKVNIAGVEWKNPVTVASGTFGSGEEFSEFVDLNRLGCLLYTSDLRVITRLPIQITTKYIFQTYQSRKM